MPWPLWKRAAVVGTIETATAQANAATAALVGEGLAATTIAGNLLGNALAGGDWMPHIPISACQWRIVGRALIRRGECLFAIQVDGGRLMILPVEGYDIAGGADPEQWTYRVWLHGPTRQSDHVLPAASVIHFRIGEREQAPWRGRPPALDAEVSASILAGIERGLRQEAAAPTGNLIAAAARPNSPEKVAGKRGVATAISAAIGELRGRTMAVAAPSASRMDATTPTAADLRQRRIGIEPPAELATIRREVAGAVLAACGVPAALADPTAATSLREGWRLFLSSWVQPVARVLAEEAAHKLGIEGVEYAPGALHGMDVRARSFASLAGGGMEVDEAKMLAGLAA